MTKKEEKMIWEALQPIRESLKGWAFSHQPEAYVTHAQNKLPSLPSFAQPAGLKMINEVRVALKMEEL